jgi:hypothetical protein
VLLTVIYKHLKSTMNVGASAMTEQLPDDTPDLLTPLKNRCDVYSAQVQELQSLLRDQSVFKHQKHIRQAELRGVEGDLADIQDQLNHQEQNIEQRQHEIEELEASLGVAQSTLLAERANLASLRQRKADRQDVAEKLARQEPQEHEIEQKIKMKCLEVAQLGQVLAGSIAGLNQLPLTLTSNDPISEPHLESACTILTSELPPCATTLRYDSPSERPTEDQEGLPIQTSTATPAEAQAESQAEPQAESQRRSQTGTQDVFDIESSEDDDDDANTINHDDIIDEPYQAEAPGDSDYIEHPPSSGSKKPPSSGRKVKPYRRRKCLRCKDRGHHCDRPDEGRNLTCTRCKHDGTKCIYRQTKGRQASKTKRSGKRPNEEQDARLKHLVEVEKLKVEEVWQRGDMGTKSLSALKMQYMRLKKRERQQPSQGSDDAALR